MIIPYDLKVRCVKESYTGKTAREIYNGIFAPEHGDSMSFSTFARKLRYWRNKQMADGVTLECGTYGGFTAHGATVQVNGNGEITQAWIKQKAEDVNWDDIKDFIRENVQPLKIDACEISGDTMLEIPLFDMHFGIASLEDYTQQTREIKRIIEAKAYDEINIIFGQDMLHTNDMRGHTAKGTSIEAADFRNAWEDAWNFWHNVIPACLEHSQKVNVIYSKGNHDECSSWCLFKALQVAFPQAHFDDTFRDRKCIHWRRCFIGVTHGEGAKREPRDLRGQFTIRFPTEFADSDVREIHAGHLHCESESDLYGVMIRRTSTAKPDDAWGNSEGYIGAHKRFMMFEWLPSRLKAVYYV